MGSVSEIAVYFAVMMGATMGITAWRLAVVRGEVRTQVDGMLGACLLVSTGLFVLAMLPSAQLS